MFDTSQLLNAVSIFSLELIYYLQFKWFFALSEVYKQLT